MPPCCLGVCAVVKIVVVYCVAVVVVAFIVVVDVVFGGLYIADWR